MIRPFVTFLVDASRARWHRTQMQQIDDALLDQLAAIVAKRLKPNRRFRPTLAITTRVTNAERQIVEAGAAARGLSLSDLIRVALAAVLQHDFPIQRDIAPGFRLGHARRKAILARDQSTALPQVLDKAELERNAVRANLRARAAADALSAADPSAARARASQAQVVAGRMVEAAPNAFPPVRTGRGT